KTLPGVFGKRCHDYSLNIRRDGGYLLAQRRWGSKQMLSTQFFKRSMKRQLSAQPFIDNNCQGILVTGWKRLALDLLRCHVRHGANNILRTLIVGGLGGKGNAKIAQQHLIASSH